MPKNRPKNAPHLLKNKLLRGLRPKTIDAADFSVDNDNAAVYSTEAHFNDVLVTAIKTLEEKGFTTFN